MSNNQIRTTVHPDDLAVEHFSAAMKLKMAASRAKGRGGWEDLVDCPADRLRAMLRDQIIKGDPVDVGNFAMMLWNRGELVAAPAPVQQAKPAADVARAIRSLRPGPCGAFTFPENAHDAGHEAAREAAARLVEACGVQQVVAVPEHLREFVEAIANCFDAIDRETDDEFCKGCSGLSVWDEDTRQKVMHHRDECIVLRAQAIIAAAPAVPEPVQPHGKPVADCGPNGVTWSKDDEHRLDVALSKTFGTPMSQDMGGMPPVASAGPSQGDYPMDRMIAAAPFPIFDMTKHVPTVSTNTTEIMVSALDPWSYAAQSAEPVRVQAAPSESIDTFEFAKVLGKLLVADRKRALQGAGMDQEWVAAKDELAAHINAWSDARLAGARKDAERLDWIITRTGYYCTEEAGWIGIAGLMVKERDHTGLIKKDVRAAIDGTAALSSSPATNSPTGGE